MFGSWLIGQAWTTPVQGLNQDAICAPRGAGGFSAVGEPPEGAPVREACFLHLRGRSEPPALPPAGLVLEEGVDPAAGALLEEPVDRDAARRAVDVAFRARLAAQTSSCRRNDRAWLKVMGGLDAKMVGMQLAIFSLSPLTRLMTSS